jgi:hypothetical protein
VAAQQVVRSRVRHSWRAAVVPWAHGRAHPMARPRRTGSRTPVACRCEAEDPAHARWTCGLISSKSSALGRYWSWQVPGWLSARTDPVHDSSPALERQARVELRPRWTASGEGSRRGSTPSVGERSAVARPVPRPLTSVCGLASGSGRPQSLGGGSGSARHRTHRRIQLPRRRSFDSVGPPFVGALPD